MVSEDIALLLGELTNRILMQENIRAISVLNMEHKESVLLCKWFNQFNFQNLKALAQMMKNILELKVISGNFWMWSPLSTEEFHSKQHLWFRKLMRVFKRTTCMRAIQCAVTQIALARIVSNLYNSKCFDLSKQNNNKKL